MPRKLYSNPFGDGGVFGGVEVESPEETEKEKKEKKKRDKVGYLGNLKGGFGNESNDFKKAMNRQRNK